jgi:hypothetical protein
VDFDNDGDGKKVWSLLIPLHGMVDSLSAGRVALILQTKARGAERQRAVQQVGPRLLLHLISIG